MKTKNYLIIAALFIFSITNAQAGTEIDGSINVGGTTRDFRIYVPDSYDGTTDVPLLFNFHGFGLTNETQEAYGEFRPIADASNFIMVLPLARLKGGGRNANTRWETFGNSENADEAAFISALIDYIANQYAIDQNRVYATGISNGGFMCYELARYGTQFAAVASVAGSMINGRISAVPNNAIPIMEIHGDADATVLYNGGNMFGAKYASVDALINYWVTNNNCNTTPVHTTYPDIDNSDNSTVERYEYSNTTTGAEVVLLKVVGGGHTWPGATQTEGGGSGAVNMDINASVEIWNFLSSHSLGEIVTPPVDPCLGFSVSMNTTDESADATCDGSISLNISEGNAAFTYSWNDGSTSSSISNLCAGTYDVTVTDANNCVASAEGQVNTAPPADPCSGFSVSTTTSNVTAKRACDGSISLTTSGGTAAFTYNWSDGSASSSISNLCAGTYDVTVTDANNCVASAQATVSTTKGRRKSLTETTGATVVESDDASLTIFPNPTADDINISVTGSSINSIQLIDLAGSVVVQTSGLDTQTYTVDCSGISTGTYFALIKLSDGTTLTKKVVIL